jgi:hypothetical protein
MTATQRLVLRRFLKRARLGVHEITPEYASMHVLAVRSLIAQGYLQRVKLVGPTRLTPLRLTIKGRKAAEKLERAA